MSRVGWLTAHLTYFSFHAPNKFPSYASLQGTAQEAAAEPSEAKVRDDALDVIAMMRAINRSADNRRRKRGQKPDR